MEVYILDSLLRRTEVFDKFESMVWTERWQAFGDFELDLNSTLENRSQFTPGTRIAINESYRVMTVKSVEDKTDEEGKKLLKVTGSSLEQILDDRVAKNLMANTTLDPKWVLTDTPGNVVRTMFDHICRLGGLHPDDVIPFLQPGTIFPIDTIPESTTPIVWEQVPASLYSAVQEVCTLYDLGFRLVRNFDTSQLYFDVYTGNDRTSQQSILDPVIFAVNLDNLQNTTEFSTIDQSKNVAYVFSEDGFAEVYGDNVDPDITGFERRAMLVSTTVPEDVVDVEDFLIQAGTQELRKHRALSVFEGELNQRGEYMYGRDYGLGDICELRNQDGVVTYKRIGEQIFVSDAEGDRSYPGLIMDLFAGTNVWLAWNNSDLVWEDMTTEVWAEM